MIGPGDLGLRDLADSERSYYSWLREADDSELASEGICPECRDPDGELHRAKHCHTCHDGHVLVCIFCDRLLPDDGQHGVTALDRHGDVMCMSCVARLPRQIIPRKETANVR